MTDQPRKWIFERVDPNTSGASGKIIDLFRNEGTPERGFLQQHAPDLAATLMARELIQNSWDAAVELRKARAEAPGFAIDFDFEDRDGERRDQLVHALDLRGLAHHANAVAPTDEERETKLGIGSGDCLRGLDDVHLVRVCKIVEHGASGMYGRWSGAESRMYLAMLSIGYNEKADGSGGTFGYGKAGLIRASHSRIVLAYTCFLPRPEEPGITRRLLGVTYWGRHTYEGESLNGFARFGHLVEDGRVVPHENEVADAVAASLGLEVRDPDVLEQLGTTFLVVDPSVTPVDLRAAVERNWWPALLEHRFSVQILDRDRNELPCRPKKNPQLDAFVQAFEHHVDGTTPTIGRRVSLGTYTPQGGETLELGTLVLVAEPGGWSFPDESTSAATDERSLVALTRDPRMIVEYHLPGRDISRRIPFVRGVFVANRAVNVLLSQTEPKAHDKWDTRESDDVPVLSTKYAWTIAERIRNEVRDFQDELRPPIDTTSAVRLSRLDERLSKLRNRRGATPPPPPRGDRPFSIHFEVERRPVGSDLKLFGHVDVALAPDVAEAKLRAQLRFAFALDEDGRRGSLVPLSIVVPSGFARLDTEGTLFEGDLLRGIPVRFGVESVPYRQDWTAELLVEGLPAAVESS